MNLLIRAAALFVFTTAFAIAADAGPHAAHRAAPPVAVGVPVGSQAAPAGAVACLGCAGESCRIFDFYAKQVEWARTQAQRPALLMQYPGLDSGKSGHLGNQNEATWRDGRWNETDLGTVVGGVVRGGWEDGREGRVRAAWRGGRLGVLL